MSLASLVDETIASREQDFLRARLRPTVLELVQRITPKYNLASSNMAELSDDLLPLAAKTPTEPTKASNVLDALARYIPTEVVTLYVAASAAMPSLKDSLGVNEVSVYWSFGLLTPILFLVIFAGKRRSGGLPALPSLTALPWWKLIASTIAFLVWALAIPTTPYLPGAAGKVVAAFAAVFVSTFLTLLEPLFDLVPKLNKPINAGPLSGDGRRLIDLFENTKESEMDTSGTLSISNGESRLDGTLLIKRGSAASPPDEATSYLGAKGLVSGNQITVTGTDDSWKGENAINITAASKL
jgi:hypothetical protein